MTQTFAPPIPMGRGSGMNLPGPSYMPIPTGAPQGGGKPIHFIVIYVSLIIIIIISFCIRIV